MAEPEHYVGMIDRHARSLTADLELAIDAIAGLHQRIYLARPNLRGLSDFSRSVRSHVDAAERIAQAALRAFWGDVYGLQMLDYDTAPTVAQIRAAIDAVAAHSARQFRARLVSRTSTVAKDVDIRIMNRAGHRVRATQMIHLAARKGLLDMVNETHLAQLIERGEVEAQIYHVDPQHESHGLRISLNGTGPSYIDLEKAFHPLSSAIVGAVTDVHS